MSILTVNAPQPFPAHGKAVFLAGTIEKGAEPHWQTVVTHALADTDAVVLNPRRDDWDSTWVEDIADPQFNAQVTWELAAQERADVIAMALLPQTQAPISLLELGLFAKTGKMIVCCPSGYWRRGNVQMVCHRYHVPLVETVAEMIALVRARL